MVPDRAGAGTAVVKIDPAGLAAGDTVKVYAYPLGWGTKSPDCASGEQTATSIVVPKDPSTLETTVEVPLGRTALVLAAPGFASECGAEGSVVVSKFDPAKLTVTVPAAAKAKGTVPLEVSGPEEAKGATLDLTITYLGPFQTAPDAAAASCQTAPVAGTGQVHVEALTQGDAPLQAGIKAPNEPGVYLVKTSLEETGRASAYDACEATSSLPTLTVTG
ncbi:MAG: hypothetical protein LBE25_09350 [Arthrobacter sp.]|jgi:hypothetical protein|nr:hypothetical protein [Arthrobacter sp.]